MAHVARKLGIPIQKPNAAKSQPRTTDKRLPSPKESNAVLSRILSLVWNSLGVFLLVLGGITAINSLRYDVSIDSYASLNPQDPLASRFVLTNEGPYRIHDVEYNCEFPNLNIPNANPDVNQTGVEGVIGLPKTELKPRGKISLRCQSPYQMIDGSFLQIRVSYRPSFWSIRTEGGNAFLLRIDNQDHAVWLPIGSLKTTEEFRIIIVQPK